MIFAVLCLLVVVGTDAASYSNGVSTGAASSSFGATNTQGQGVNGGYTETGTYGANYPYTQQYSNQFSLNSNYPNNVPYQYRPFQNQFQNPFNNFQNPYQNGQAQFQNQFLQQQQQQNQFLQQQQQQFPFFQLPPLQFAPFYPAPFTPPEYQQAFAQFQNSILQQQNSLQQQIASGGSFAYSTPGASAQALTSLGPANLYNQQQEAWKQWQNGNAGSVPYYAPNYAAATATYGNDGVQQTASVYPPNPQSPNIDNRFQPDDTSKFFGVSTSSFSTSSDINGVKSQHGGAITSVNDNGKVTTYQVKN